MGPPFTMPAIHRDITSAILTSHYRKSRWLGVAPDVQKVPRVTILRHSETVVLDLAGREHFYHLPTATE
jgi:hypothetical protein